MITISINLSKVPNGELDVCGIWVKGSKGITETAFMNMVLPKRERIAELARKSIIYVKREGNTIPEAIILNPETLSPIDADMDGLADLDAVVVKTMYESNPDTNAYDDAEKAKNHDQNTDEYLATELTSHLYVDGSRTDSYTETGSRTKPFKTINASIASISAAGTTLIEVLPGVYAENVVIDNANITDLRMLGHTSVGINPASGDALSCIANNDGLTSFYMEGFGFSKPVTLIGASNGTSFCSSDGRFRDCVFIGKLTVKNCVDLEPVSCQIASSAEVENCAKFFVSGGEGMGPSQLDITWNASNDVPSGVTFCYALFERNVCLASTVNVSAGATLQLRSGVRFSNPGGTTTINGTFLAYSSYIWSGTINVVGSFTNRGSFYNPTALNVTGTFTNETKGECVAFNVTTPADWTATPADIGAALNELAARVKTLEP